MALTILTDVKNYFGIPLTEADENAKLALMIAAADAVLKRAIGYDIEDTTYPGAATGSDGDSGYYNGNDSRFLMLRQVPARSITSVYVDSDGYAGSGTDPFPADTLLVVGDDYYLETDGCLPGTSTKVAYKGVLVRVGAIWPAVRVRNRGNLVSGHGAGLTNIKIAYVGGYTTVPADISNACIQLVAWMRNTASYGGAQLQSERFEDYQYVLGKAGEGLAQIGSLRSVVNYYKARSKRVA